MRGKVRPVEPPTDASELEGFVVEALPDTDFDADARTARLRDLLL
jgi:hypothetical protein